MAVLDRVSPSGLFIPLGSSQLVVLSSDGTVEAVSVLSGATALVQIPMTTGLLSDRVIDLLPPNLGNIGGDLFFGIPVFADIGAGVINAFARIHNNGTEAKSVEAGIWTSLVLR
jgi:hypothetical protein